jgi:hypothetical protein
LPLEHNAMGGKVRKTAVGFMNPIKINGHAQNLGSGLFPIMPRNTSP